MNFWYVLVKSFFFKICSNDKIDLLERYKFNYFKGINVNKFLMENMMG